MASQNELALRMRRISVSDERLRRENVRAQRVEAEVMRERGERADRAAAEKKEMEERDEMDAFERYLFGERETVLMQARSRRMEAEEANRLGDEAVWKHNLEIRERNALSDMARRRERRLVKHEEERQRIDPYVKLIKAAHDGRIDNKALAGGTNWAPPVVAYRNDPVPDRESKSRKPGAWAY